MLNTIPVKQHLGIQKRQSSEHVDLRPRSAHLPFSGLLNSMSAFPTELRCQQISRSPFRFWAAMPAWAHHLGMMLSQLVPQDWTRSLTLSSWVALSVNPTKMRRNGSGEETHCVLGPRYHPRQLWSLTSIRWALCPHL